MRSKKWTVYICSALLIVVMAYLGHEVERTRHLTLISGYTIAFALYMYLYRQLNDCRAGLVLAIICRMAMLGSLPLLSEDVYRFLWDGNLVLLSENPYTSTPEQLHESFRHLPIVAELYPHLNSPTYYSVYPPFSQVFFIIAVWLGNSLQAQIEWLRLILILGECATFYLLLLLCRQYTIPNKRILLYALNPLIILEISANFHFEGLVLLTVLAAIYQLKRQAVAEASGLMAVAAGLKLLPIILLPQQFFSLSAKQKLNFTSIFILSALLIFSPLLLTGFSGGFTESLGLYFQKFEMNGSIYLLLRTVGFWLAGFNIIAYLGVFLALAVFLSIMIYSYKYRSNQNFPLHAMWITTIFLLGSTTVHPWYIVPIIGYSIFSAYRYAILWSFLILLTYLQYTPDGFVELTWVMAVEYGLLGFFFLSNSIHRHLAKLRKNH